MTKSANLNRRELLRRAATVLGVSAISPGIASAVMAGAKAGALPQKARLLTAQQLDLLAVLTEMILPTTDTPGATAAGVHHFIDVMVSDYFAPAHRDHFLKGLANVNARAKARDFKSFLDADNETRHSIAVELDQAAYGSSRQYPESADVLLPFFRELKELTLVGYYTSKVGATMELAYDPIPGNYDGCVPYKTLGRAWAT